METFDITSSVVKYSGIFKMSEVYKVAFSILADELGYDIEESKYREKVSSDGKELEIKWIAEKKISDYYKFRIKVDFFVVGLKDVEVEKSGVKVKMNKGNIDITIKSSIITDWEGRWESSPVLRFLQGLFDKYVQRNTFQQMKARIYEEAYKFENEMKAFFNLTRFM